MRTNVRYPRAAQGPADITPSEREGLDLINRRVAAGDSLGDIIDFLFARISRLIPCDRLSVAFLEDGLDRMTLFHAASGGARGLDEGYSADISRSSLGEIFRGGTPRVIDDLAVYSREKSQGETTRLLLTEGMRSSLTWPLAVDGRPAGVLFCNSKTPGAYGEREIAILGEIAERIAQAVEKAWRIERLRAAVEGYSEMLGFVTHELKSPIDSVLTMGNTLLAGFYGELDARQDEVVRRMLAQLAKLTGIIQEYLHLARFEGVNAALNARAFDFSSEVISPSLETHAPQIEEKRMRVETTVSSSAAYGDPALLLIVTNNFISNAVKYGKEGGTIKITAGERENKFLVTVWNEGPGFPREQKARLFRKFSRIDSAELMKRKGSGIGLYNSWKIILLHGGSVGADSEPGAWASFCFEIPARRA